MKTSTQDSYALLKERLESWKADSASHSDARPVEQAFLLAARETLVPELTKLAMVITDAGVECEVFEEHDAVAVGIRIPALRAVLCLSAAANPTFIRAVLSNGCRHGDQLEWFIPYHLVRKGLLERELQAAVVRTLKPVRPL